MGRRDSAPRSLRRTASRADVYSELLCIKRVTFEALLAEASPVVARVCVFSQSNKCSRAALRAFRPCHVAFRYVRYPSTFDPSCDPSSI